MKNNKKYITWKNFFLTLALLFTLIISIITGFVANLVKDQPVLSKEELTQQLNDISENSDIFFSNGEKVATINSEMMRKTIPLDDMGDNIKNAIIASEDDNFYSNSGIEPFSIIRASVYEAAGKSSTGGSTITQQLVKNQLLDNSRSYERKAKEILLAIRLNNTLSKSEILETYLNIAPFGKNRLGQNISGIETAALGVFNVHANELNIAQAAYLAGFVQLPYKYTPFDNSGNIRSDEELQAGFNRQKYVLNRMLEEDFITKEEYNQALEFDIKSSFNNNRINESEKYPYITNEVITAASEILAEDTAKKNNQLNKYQNDANFKNDLLEKSKVKFLTGGYKVRTTINKELYDTLQEAKENYSRFISKNIDGQNYPMEIGATLIENNTGRVLAFIGGRDFNNQQLNHATRTTRSPGSTIKPLLVFAPAIDKGYITPNSMLLDRKFNYNGWSPDNFSKTEFGVISARNALAKSLNLSTIRLYSAFSNEDPVKEYLEKMNFKSLVESDHTNLSASIGGLSYGVTVLENTNAFSTLANKGKFQQAYIIESIEDNTGKTIYTANFNPVQVYSESTSYLTINMLNDVITGGTAGNMKSTLKFSTDNLFVKTGTSEYNHDLWTVGGTKNITFGLWTGYDKPSELPGFDHAHNQWAYFMNAIYNYNPSLIGADNKFEQPASVKKENINPYNNSKGSVTDIVPNSFQELNNDKVMKKFGSTIDKNVLEKLRPPSPKKEDDDDEDDKKENNDKRKEEDITDLNNIEAEVVNDEDE
ncbi:transglycosylase domain-containing protein [Gemella sp. GH3]|uniref:transglycosylase domain-containing protein n=1 Tax=unclassified Gemella TaxID=2624949 RepID=UPI00351B4FB5